MPTLASDIITRAYRTPNIIPLVSTAGTNQQAEALPLLNEQILSALGFEAGSELRDLNIGGAFDRSQVAAQFVPANARLVCNTGTTLKLDPFPYEGQRLAAVDASGTFSTSNLVLDGNGRQIEGAATVTLNTDNDSRQWIYRADIANWVKITDLIASDTMPFPQEFDGFFVKRLAMDLSPAYGQSLAAETVAALNRIEAKLRARYRQRRRVQDMDTLSQLNSTRAGLTQSYSNGSTPFW